MARENQERWLEGYVGPCRLLKRKAESDAEQLRQAALLSSDALNRLLQDLREVTVVERKIYSFEGILRPHMQSLLSDDASGLTQRNKKCRRRALQVDEHIPAFEASELLVMEHKATESLAQEEDAAWLRDLGLHWRLDYGSRPLGTAGFDAAWCIVGYAIWAI